MVVMGATLCFAVEFTLHGWYRRARPQHCVGSCPWRTATPATSLGFLSGPSFPMQHTHRCGRLWKERLPLRQQRGALWRMPRCASTSRAPTEPGALGELADLVPPPLGEPQLPDIATPWRPSSPDPQTTPPHPKWLKDAHAEAARLVMQGYRRGLKTSTVVVPSGIGDGIVGAAVLRQVWDLRKRTMPTFRAIVLVSKEAMPSAEVEYKAVAGGGLLVFPIEPGLAGVDQVAKALGTARGLVLLGTYADAPRIRMALSRTRSKIVDFLVSDTAHIPLVGDPDVKALVGKFGVKILQQLFVSACSLEFAPTKGLEDATMEVPGVASYHVVTAGESKFGPELYSMPYAAAVDKGLAVPVELVFISDDVIAEKGKAGALAQLHDKLGVSCIHVPATAGATDVQSLNADLQSATSGACQVDSSNGIFNPALACPDALLLDDPQLDPAAAIHALGHVALRRSTGSVSVVVAGSTGAAAAAGWKTMIDFDDSFRSAMQAAAVHSARHGRLAWQDLPKRLQAIRLVGASPRDSQPEAVAAIVRGAIDFAVDEWYTWYGRLLAYRDRHGQGQVPVDATLNGHELGRWVARQFLEWRWGSLDSEKKNFLAEGSCSIENETERYFEQGCLEFEAHMDKYQDPYISADHWTDSGFALGAWAVAQRAAWRQGKLDVKHQYLLDDLGFGPVAHPAQEGAREGTMYAESRMRDARGKPLSLRQKVFRAIVHSFHPDFFDGENGPQVTQFLAAYRDWFLHPPPRYAPEPADPEQLWKELDEAIG